MREFKNFFGGWFKYFAKGADKKIRRRLTKWTLINLEVERRKISSWAAPRSKVPPFYPLNPIKLLLVPVNLSI